MNYGWIHNYVGGSQPLGQASSSEYIETKYGFVDPIHFRTGGLKAFDILNNLKIGNPQFSEFEQAGPPTVSSLLPFWGVRVEYQVPIPLPENLQTGVALAIFEDLELHFERWQLISTFDLNSSGFSIEDLPSDYLGFYACTMQLTGPKCNDEDNKGLNQIVNILGGNINQGGEPAKCNAWITRLTNSWDKCREIKNFSFIPRVYDSASQQYMNVSWPYPLNDLTPIFSGWSEKSCEGYYGVIGAKIITTSCP